MFVSFKEERCNMEVISELLGKVIATGFVWIVALAIAGACMTAAHNRGDLFLVLAAGLVLLVACLMTRGVWKD